MLQRPVLQLEKMPAMVPRSQLNPKVVLPMRHLCLILHLLTSLRSNTVQQGHASPAPAAHVEPEEQSASQVAEATTEAVLAEPATKAPLDAPREQMDD